jgi:hypothetical protein
MNTDLIERLSGLLPVSWDNELDGHGEPTHANLTFGEHPTQAMTLRPDDWMALNELIRALTQADARIARLEEALKQVASRSHAALNRGE